MGRYTHTDWWGQLSQADQQWTNWALNQVGMNNFAKREISSLSDGERQKSLIARVLTQNTPIFLLDEPTAHLDLPNRIKNFQLFKKLSQQQNKALLLSTHELDLALKYADEIWLMDGKGELTVGTTQTFIHSGELERVFGLSINDDEVAMPLRIKNQEL